VLNSQKNAETLTLFLEDCSLTLSEPVLASSVKDVEVLVLQIEEYSQKIKEIKHVLDKLVDIHAKVTEQKQNPEAFSRMTKESCEKKIF